MAQDRRIELQAALEAFLGSENVYYQPPESRKLKYPCIVYTRERIWRRPADNRAYLLNWPYSVTLIYRDPDSNLPLDLVDAFPYCSHNRHYAANNLYHDNYTLYY